MTESNCLFCKIVEKKILAEIVYEDDSVVAFLDIEPRAPGHVVVVPRRHAETIEDLNEEEIRPFFSAAKTVLGKVVAGLGADGATIGINHRRAAGQVVEHLHLHIMPRFYKDGGGAIQSVVSNKPKESLAEIKKKILKNTDWHKSAKSA